ncbi:MAG TPA: regulatory protein RecX [bacterium]|nr:regulatory protein RecX [bacterium]HPJ72507.1 regulatory protein RecX [bacterium]HPQ66791.1 regulatory protein RecX [bacterium]
MPDPEEQERRAAREYALRLLDYRERSSGELARRLMEKGFGEAAARFVLDGLRKSGLVDDERFARLWVTSRLRARPRSRRLIGIELARRGISRDSIRSVLDALMPEDGEEELARSLAAGRARFYRGDDPLRRRRKLGAWLARRGFAPDLIGRILEEMGEE